MGRYIPHVPSNGRLDLHDQQSSCGSCMAASFARDSPLEQRHQKRSDWCLVELPLYFTINHRYRLRQNLFIQKQNSFNRFVPCLSSNHASRAWSTRQLLSVQVQPSVRHHVGSVRGHPRLLIAVHANPRKPFARLTLTVLSNKYLFNSRRNVLLLNSSTE